MKSELPFWVQYLQAFSLPVLAVVAAWIAYRQYRTAHDKLRLELFDRRLQVFIDTSKFIGNVRQASIPELEDLRTLFRALDGAAFLFDEEIRTYLSKLHEIAHQLRVTSNKMKQTDDEMERSIISEKNSKLYTDFDNLGDEIVPLFSNYMRFSRVKEHKKISLNLKNIRMQADRLQKLIRLKGRR